MIVDDNLINLIKRLAGEFGNYEFGNEIIDTLYKCYTIDKSIQQATLELVNYLFGNYGLLVLIADNKILKQQMIPIFKDEIINETSIKIVKKTSTELASKYKIQASGREINLFYLTQNGRYRIEKTTDGKYIIIGLSKIFTKEELLLEIENYPENFSPNVILRGLYQEIIMPNIAFIGGGGELAYWLQLKDLFTHYSTPFPLIVLRNSFLLLTKKQKEDWQKLNFSIAQLFESNQQLENLFAQKNSKNSLTTIDEKKEIESIYQKIKENVLKIDSSLVRHIDALKTKQINKLNQLDKKLLRAEKRNFNISISKINRIKNNLFPNQNLQERYDNIIPYYSKYGKSLIENILENSLALNAKFTLLTIE